MDQICSSFMDSSNLVAILVFIILGCLFVYIIKLEQRDIRCPQGLDTTNLSLCKDGNGKNYHKAKPEIGDSVSTLLNKIKISATAGRKDVIWRRAFIIGCICTIGIFLICFRSIPSVPQVVTIIIIITMTVYVLHSYFDYHHYFHIEDSILKSVDAIIKNIKSSK